ncbi:decapping and exoribonuclease protein-like isoform X2 [Dermacentor albipictus]|uniref:decapping and exoribonuclease protein-like isoform X2 n=1 Tax=Dermacentor albipictus TaxID=60249 RepID=UPI0031FE15C2
MSPSLHPGMAYGHDAYSPRESPPQDDHPASYGNEIASMAVIFNSSSQRDHSLTFDVPREIGCYSVGGKTRTYIDSPVNKRYLRADIPCKTAEINLKYGLEGRVPRDWTKSAALENLLHWVDRNRGKVMPPCSSEETQRVRPDFICSRDVLKLFLCTPYLAKDEWRVAARRIEGVVYLRNVLSKAEQDRRRGTQEGKANWSSRFRQHMVSCQRSSNVVPDKIADETQTYHAVLQSQLGTHKIIFEAEVMAVDNSQGFTKSGLNPYVEFRTCIDFDGFKKGEKYLRYKSLKWWAHARLAGASSLVCGSCSESGMVKRIEKLQISDIPKKTKFWKEEECMRFCDNVLSFIKEYVRDDERTYLFNVAMETETGHSSRRKVECRRLQNPSRIPVLPDWYLQSMVTGKSTS